MTELKFGRPYSMVVWGALEALLVFAAYRSLILGYADAQFHRGSPQSIRRAVEIVPSKARYHLSNAAVMQQLDPSNPLVDHEFSEAVRINPRYSDALVAWSVREEFLGHNAEAEQMLLSAERTDKLVKPMWSLANFYFRQGDADKFWPEAKKCLTLIGSTGLSEGRYDPAAIYQLAWSLTDDPDVISSRMLPEDRIIRMSYGFYLMANNRVKPAVGVSSQLLQDAHSNEGFFFVHYGNFLVSHGLIPEAVRTWAEMYRRGVASHPAPDPAGGAFLTNGGFSAAPTNQAFDWKLMAQDPVRFTYVEGAHAYRFDFDGNQPERTPLLVQTLPLLPSRKYLLTVKFRTEGDVDPNALIWRLVVHPGDQAVGTQVHVKPEQSGGLATVDFETPSETTLGNLFLEYARQLGTQRADGAFEITNADLRLR